ncbi:hypothetical protein SAMN05444362_11233 [Dysgonomonas macrotermitis]|uniref:T9SS C-terminal target domain-containing protein n=2 Tax=Dysgonomonas macrotermitis TaxID=1346286 RepID=A0A1M5FKZ2_9BACT|nr:hypothetical protein SAMN05444362_11233 [Dysgonomonas macrotermitis]
MQTFLNKRLFKMKTFNFFAKMLFVMSAVVLSACSDNGDDNSGGGGGTTEQILFGDGTQIGNGDQEFTIKESHTLKKGTYVLKGWVYVDAGATLTIEPGTIIKGDKATKAALIVQRGGKIMAEGSATAPIIFTSNQAKGSRKPGDWGGVILLGKAKNNGNVMTIEGGPNADHGGSDDTDNSGVLSYVRIEFAGYPFKEDQEINGLTLGSVGSGTKLDHIQVSYSNDDSYEWFGGTVSAKYLVAYHGWDDDFDTDNGFSGKLQFLLSVRHPKIADYSLSNGFESDNNKDGVATTPFTSAVFSNVTFIGPIGQDASFANTTQYITGGDMFPDNGSKLGTFQAAMHIRRNSRLNCFNSVAVGFPVGLILDNEKGTTQTAATDGNLKLQNLYFAGMTILGSDINKNYLDQLSTDGKTISDAGKPSFSSTFFRLTANNNKVYDNISDLKLKQPNSLIASPSYAPSADSPLLGAAAFTDAALQSGFDKVSYVGAFASDAAADNWLAGWTNFDPQNTTY